MAWYDDEDDGDVIEEYSDPEPIDDSVDENDGDVESEDYSIPWDDELDEDDGGDDEDVSQYDDNDFSDESDVEGEVDDGDLPPSPPDPTNTEDLLSLNDLPTYGEEVTGPAPGEDGLFSLGSLPIAPDAQFETDDAAAIGDFYRQAFPPFDQQGQVAETPIPQDQIVTPSPELPPAPPVEPQPTLFSSMATEGEVPASVDEQPSTDWVSSEPLAQRGAEGDVVGAVTDAVNGAIQQTGFPEGEKFIVHSLVDNFFGWAEQQIHQERTEREQRAVEDPSLTHDFDLARANVAEYGVVGLELGWEAIKDVVFSGELTKDAIWSPIGNIGQLGDDVNAQIKELEADGNPIANPLTAGAVSIPLPWGGDFMLPLSPIRPLVPLLAATALGWDLKQNPNPETEAKVAELLSPYADYGERVAQGWQVTGDAWERFGRDVWYPMVNDLEENDNPIPAIQQANQRFQGLMATLGQESEVRDKANDVGILATFARDVLGQPQQLLLGAGKVGAIKWPGLIPYFNELTAIPVIAAQKAGGMIPIIGKETISSRATRESWGLVQSAIQSMQHGLPEVAQAYQRGDGSVFPLFAQRIADLTKLSTRGAERQLVDPLAQPLASLMVEEPVVYRAVSEAGRDLTDPSAFGTRVVERLNALMPDPVQAKAAGDQVLSSFQNLSDDWARKTGRALEPSEVVERFRDVIRDTYRNAQAGSIAAGVPATDVEQVLARRLEGNSRLAQALIKAAGDAPDEAGFARLAHTGMMTPIRQAYVRAQQESQRAIPLVGSTLERIGSVYANHIDPIIHGLGRGLAAFYLPSAQYLYGGVIENAARTWMGGAPGAWASKEAYRRATIASGFRLPAHLAFDHFELFGQASLNPNASRNVVNMVEQAPIVGPIAKKILDTASYLEQSMRQGYVLRRYEGHLASAVDALPQPVRAAWNDAQKAVDGAFGSVYTADQRRALTSELRYAMLAGAPAVRGVIERVNAGHVNREAIEQLLKQSGMLPQVTDALAQAATAGNPRLVEDAIQQAYDAADLFGRQMVAGRSQLPADILTGYRDKALELLRAHPDPTSNALDEATARALIEQTVGATNLIHQWAIQNQAANLALTYFRNRTGAERRAAFEEAYASSVKLIPDAYRQYVEPVVARLSPYSQHLGVAAADDFDGLMTAGLRGLQRWKEASDTAWTAHQADLGQYRARLAQASTTTEREQIKSEAIRDVRGFWKRLYGERSKALADELNGYHRQVANLTSSARVGGQVGPQATADRIAEAGGQFGLPRGTDLLSAVPTNHPSLGSVATTKSTGERGLWWRYNGNLAESIDKQFQELDGLAEQIRRHALTDPKASLASFNGFAQGLVSTIEQQPTAWVRLGQAALQEAGDRATSEYRIHFPNYETTTYLTTAMQALYPFWRYESSRWPYLATTAMRHPALAEGMQEYYDRSDQGYIALPKMPMFEGSSSFLLDAFANGELQFNPPASTVFAAPRGVLRPDFGSSSPLEQEAFNAAYGRDTHEGSLTPWEQWAIQKPILRDWVILNRLDDVYQATRDFNRDGYETLTPGMRGWSGAWSMLNSTLERYGFFASPLVNMPRDVAEGQFFSGVGGPLVHGALDLLEAAPRSIPIVGDVGSMITGARKEGGLLHDPFRQYLINHILYGRGVDLTQKIPPEEQQRAAQDAAELAAFQGQVAGFRYREEKRQDVEMGRPAEMARVYRPEQRDYLFGQLGVADWDGAIKAMKERGTTAQAILEGQAIPDAQRARLALDPQQRKAVANLQDAEQLRAASQPFKSETQQQINQLFSTKREIEDKATEKFLANLELVRQDRNPDGSKHPFSVADAWFQYTRDRSAASKWLNQTLENSQDYAEAKAVLEAKRQREKASPQDKWLDQYYGTVSTATGPTGQVDWNSVNTAQETTKQRIQGEIAAESDPTQRQFLTEQYRAFEQQVRSSQPPIIQDAFDALRQFQARVPKYNGVPAGSQQQRDIDAAFARRREVSMRSPSTQVTSQIMTRDYPAEQHLWWNYRTRRNKQYSPEKKRLINSNRSYGLLFGSADDPEMVDDLDQQVRSQSR